LIPSIPFLLTLAACAGPARPLRWGHPPAIPCTRAQL
jgi:hypothetical protein